MTLKIKHNDDSRLQKVALFIVAGIVLLWIIYKFVFTLNIDKIPEELVWNGDKKKCCVIMRINEK